MKADAAITTIITNKMPRISMKKRFLGSLTKLLNKRLQRRALRTINDEEDSLEDAKDLAVAMALKNGFTRRYLFRNPKYRKGIDRFNDDLDDGELNVDDDELTEEEASQLPWLTEDEFIQKYRMSRESFNKVLEMIERHKIFKSEGKRGRKQAPVAHQLMVFLKFIGTEGTGASNANQRHTFAIGYGTAEKYRRRVTKALLQFRDKYIHWPDGNERKQISQEIHRLYDFPHCVAIADGTLFPLAFEPQTQDAPDYSGRKYGYSISTMIVCDHKRRIRYYLSGYPGSAHDNRVFKGTALHKNPTSHFSPMQYLVGDSAFANDWFCVAAFKKLANCTLGRDEERFNTKLSKLRIISEHCIGILKGRFPWLRSIRLVITEDIVSLKRILQLIDATIILHNILIDIGEEGKDDWIDLDDFSDMDEAARAPYDEDDELNQSVPLWAPKHTRRTQILQYFKEFFFLN